MKIMICNIPIRSEPTTFPPIACATLCNVLINNGYDPVFYDIDAFRPSFKDISDYLMAEKFDIIGISVVVSTGYSYMKKLTSLIKRISPRTQIVMGGNLAAASNVVLHKCQVDVCVIGEGERVLLSLVRHWEHYGHFKPNDDLFKIRGISFLNSENTICFTSKEELIARDEIQQPDYELLEKYSNIDQYILDPLTRHDFAYDSRSHSPELKGKKMATILTSKGCINRCTFCHRFIEKYRIIPVKQVVDYIKYLIDKYNVGFFCITDECFGEDQHWLDDFISLVKPLNILFQVAGARVSIIKKDPSVIKRLKDAGLTAIYFGMETGSEKILKIMEKNATKAQNMEAARICADAGVYTVMALVIGMPGENKQTIAETIDFVKQATENSPYFPELSINYLQALPGTPTYEYLRLHGFLGNTVEEEEEYLIRVSDKNASEFSQYINVTEEPLDEVRTWRLRIWMSTQINWLRKHKWAFNGKEIDKFDRTEKISLKIKIYLKNSIYTFKLAYVLNGLFWKAVAIYYRLSLFGLAQTLKISIGAKRDDRKKFRIDGKSLRVIVKPD